LKQKSEIVLQLHYKGSSEKTITICYEVTIKTDGRLIFLCDLSKFVKIVVTIETKVRNSTTSSIQRIIRKDNYDLLWSNHQNRWKIDTSFM